VWTDELLRATEDHEAAVERAIGCQVGDALDAMQELPRRALVDVRPGLADLLVLLLVEIERDACVKAIEADEEFVRAPNPGEGVDDAGLLPDIPGVLLMTARVPIVEPAAMRKRQLGALPGRRIVAVEAQAKRLEEGVCRAGVLLGAVGRNRALDDDDTWREARRSAARSVESGACGQRTLLEELISEVAVGVAGHLGERRLDVLVGRRGRVDRLGARLLLKLERGRRRRGQHSDRHGAG